MDNKEKIKRAKEMAQEMSLFDLVKNPEDLTVKMIWRMFWNAGHGDKHASEIQYRETKEAFYVGFSECFKLMYDASTRFDEDRANDLLVKINSEIHRSLEEMLNEAFGE